MCRTASIITKDVSLVSVVLPQSSAVPVAPYSGSFVVLDNQVIHDTRYGTSGWLLMRYTLFEI